MSAYITKLDILGFNGGAAAWTSKVNTVEEGGGGGGSMSEACFTLDLSTTHNRYEWMIEVFNRDENAEFQSNRIRLNTDIRPYDEGGTAIETQYLKLTVTHEYEGLFPDSVSLRVTSQYNTTEGLLEYDDDPIAVEFYDVNDQYLGGCGYDREYYIYDFIDSGDVSVILTYPTTRMIWDEELQQEVEVPYESPGLHYIVAIRCSGMAS